MFYYMNVTNLLDKTFYIVIKNITLNITYLIHIKIKLHMQYKLSLSYILSVIVFKM